MVGRGIDVNDEVDAVDVDSACCDVRCDEDRGAAVLETLEDAGALVLCLAAVKRLGSDADCAEAVGDSLATELGAGEHDGASVAGTDLGENGILLSTIDEENVVLHRVDACAAVFGGVGDVVGQELTNQRLDLTVEGCREQQTLSVCGGLAEDRANLGQEAHVRHLIGFVECGDFHRVEDAGALTQVVAETTRRCDEDVYAAAKLIDLLGERRSTDSGANRESECSGVGVEGVDHLESKLTGGDEHECAGTLGGRAIFVA